MKISITYNQSEINYILRDWLERTYNLTKKNPLTISWREDYGVMIEFDGENKERKSEFDVED